MNTIDLLYWTAPGLCIGLILGFIGLRLVYTAQELPDAVPLMATIFVLASVCSLWTIQNSPSPDLFAFFRSTFLNAVMMVFAVLIAFLGGLACLGVMYLFNPQKT